MRFRLGLFSAAHFLVDLSCAMLLLGKVCQNSDPAQAVLLYNFFAFAVQMPLGLLADHFGKCKYFSSAGCLLCAAGWLFPPGLTAAAAVGLGNAAFHVGGGLDTLNAAGNRAGPLGLFVSTGAVGLYLGRQWADSAAALPLCMLLLSAAIALLLVREGPDHAPPALPRGGAGLWGAAACLFIVVVLRSYMGLAAAFPWKAGMGLAAVCAAALGKAAGGYLADYAGMIPTALISLGLSALCYLFSDSGAAGLAALFLFNMTMPLTLWAAARLLLGLKGFSFGLLTFGLFLGFLPFYYGYGGIGPVYLAAGALFSIPLLISGIRETERRGCG